MRASAEATRVPGKWLIRFLILAIAILLGAFTCTPEALAQATNREVILIEVFTRTDSEPCRRAVEFVQNLAKERGGIRVDVRNLLDDLPARNRFWDLAKRFGIKQPGLPAFYVFDQLQVGFTDVQTSGPAIEKLFQIRAFVRSSCPHCRDAKQFLSSVERRWPAVRTVYHDLDYDPAARQEMNDLATRYGRAATGLPVIELCGHLLGGYQSDDTSGAEIEKLLRRASPPKGEESPAPPASQGAAFAPSFFPVALWPSATAISFSGEPGRTSVTASSDAAPAKSATQDDHAANDPDSLDAIPLLPPVVEEQPSATNPTPSRSSMGSTLPPEGVSVPAFGYLRMEDYGLFMFTVVLGLIDGFNPCAMWVLVFVLSVLINVKSRAKILLIAGTFVVVSGLAYFAFMTAWLNLFLLIGWMRPIQVALGALAVSIGAINIKDFFAFKKGLSLSIPESVKPGIYARVRQLVAAKYLTAALATATVLAVTVNVVELLCTAGLPAVYMQILAGQNLPALANYAYTALYVVAYMFDDSVMLGVAVATLSMAKMQETQGRWLKLLSGAVLASLGLVMIVTPQWLQLA